MEKNVSVILILFLFTLFMNCGSSDTGEEEQDFIVRGTVSVNGELYEGALVEFGYRLSTNGTFSDTRIPTDSSGAYEFVTKFRPGNLGRSRYRIRAQNPLTEVWGDYREAGISLGVPREQNFYF